MTTTTTTTTTTTMITITILQEAQLSQRGRAMLHVVEFLSRVNIQTRDIDIANLSVCPSVRLSVRYVPVSDENGLT